MSGGGGSIAAMIASIKANKALRMARRNRFKANQNLYATKSDEALEFKEVSKEELAKIRHKNLAKIKQQELNRFLKFIGMIMLIGLVSYILFEVF